MRTPVLLGLDAVLLLVIGAAGGAMALAAFRERVGDQAFFATLRTWLDERRNGNGTVADFLATMERVSGKPVGDIAQTWLYASIRPPAPPAWGHTI